MTISFRLTMAVVPALSLMLTSVAAETSEQAGSGAAVTNGRMFAYAPGHFRFLLPEYWEVIPHSDVERYKNTLRKLYPRRPLQNYVLAIQRKALLKFTMPYALIEIQAGPMPTEEEVESEALEFAPGIRKAYVDLYRSNLFGEVQPMPATYDPVRHVVIGYCRMFRAKDKRHLVTLTAIYPCRYGYVRFHFTLREDEEDKYLPVIERTVESVTFDKGFAYDPALAGKRKSSTFKYAMCAIVVVLGLIWIVFRLFGSRLFSNKKPPAV